MPAPKGSAYWKHRLFSGRPKLYETPEDFANSVADYFADVEENALYETQIIKVRDTTGAESVKVFKRPLPRCTTLSGLAVFLGISHETLLQYEKREKYTEIVTRAREIMFDRKLEGAAAGLFNSSIIARDLGLAEKSEQRIIPEQPLFDLSDDKAEEPID